MNREIIKIVNRVVSEEFSGRISNIKNRLFENKGSEMCEACGSGDMYEGECMECGNMYEGNTQELGDNNEEEGFPEWEKLKKQMDDRNSYKDMGGEISLERALMEEFGITAKKAKEKAEAIKVLLIK